MNRKSALRFVLLLGVVSLFADCAYEGARSITGPYMAVLGAGAAAVGIVSGAGELFGYVLRLLSGRISEQTGRFWTIAILGYVLQMAAVPLLALAGNWQVAALLIVMERTGKAVRNPPVNTMVSHAAEEIGYGWAFGLEEALDQCGALIGPLIVSAVLSSKGRYPLAFAVLLIPAVLTVATFLTARFLYSRPEDLHIPPRDLHGAGLPRNYWVYLAGASLLAAGFVDFPLMAYHFQKTGQVPQTWVPIFYSVAMGVSGIGSLIFGRLFDRYGLRVLLPVPLIAACAPPLVFLGGFSAGLAGTALWGLAMGVQGSVTTAAIAAMVPAARRPSAYGIFTAGYGVAWFIGSALVGVLYGISIPAVITLSALLELAAIPFLLRVSSVGQA